MIVIIRFLQRVLLWFVMVIPYTTYGMIPVPNKVQQFWKRTILPTIFTTATTDILIPWMTVPASYAISTTSTTSSSTVAASTSSSSSLLTHSVMTWQWENGIVQISDPFLFGNMILHQPKLLGSGGGGVVLSMTNDHDNLQQQQQQQQQQDDKKLYAVKISWSSTSNSIQKECHVLQLLEQHHVTNVERCLGIQSYHSVSNNYKDDEDTNRVMILLEPVMEDPLAESISDLQPSLQKHAVEMLINSMLQMLMSNVAVTDVQVLISKETGDVLFIDLSEAQILSSSKLEQPLSFLEQAILSNFIQEVYALIPEHQMDTATKIILQWFQQQQQQQQQFFKEEDGVFLRDETVALLQEQFGLDGVRIGEVVETQ